MALSFKINLILSSDALIPLLALSNIVSLCNISLRSIFFPSLYLRALSTSDITISKFSPPFFNLASVKDTFSLSYVLFCI